MNRSTMNSLMICGAILVLVGLLAFAVPEFSTQHTEDVARIGNLKLQTTEHEWYFIPPIVSGGALVLGVILMGAGFYQRR
jgi:hypothetical protein